MDRYLAIAHRVIPAAGSEWPLTEFGRVIATEHAANVIRAEFEIMLAEIEKKHPAAAALRETFPDADVAVRDLPTLTDAIATEDVE